MVYVKQAARKLDLGTFHNLVVIELTWGCQLAKLGVARSLPAFKRTAVISNYRNRFFVSAGPAATEIFCKFFMSPGITKKQQMFPPQYRYSAVTVSDDGLRGF